MDTQFKRLLAQKKIKKKRIDLSVHPVAWEKGKETAKELKKSLSQYTEDMWIDMNENFFGLSKNPGERLKHFKKQIKDMEEVYKNKLHEEKKDNNQ